MMLAGYLSAEAYRALKPKKQIGELSFSDCYEFEPEICNELKRFFEEDTLMESLYYLEKIEESINLEWNNIHNLLLKCIKEKDEDLLSVINAIGEKTFAMDYVFCTDACFKELDYVTDHNFEVLNQVRNQFAVLYKSYFEVDILSKIMAKHYDPAITYTDNVSEDTFMESEPFGKYSIVSGRGFSYKNIFVIDDDALSINNFDCKKYVLYLYSLDLEQFEKFQDYLFTITSKCSVRLSNAIESIGYRNFLVNFLFADESKLYQIRNLGKKSLSDFNSIKPQIINFIINEYNGANTEAIEEEIQRGFSCKNIFVIDDDTLSINNFDCKKYVLYLYSLDLEQFEKFQDYLFTITSKCSVRLSNAIESIGYRNFLVNFLFADESKLYQIRNLGKKSLSDFNSIKPQIINFIINEYNEANTEAVEEEIQKRDELKKNELLTLKEKVGETQYALLTNLLKTLMSKVSVRTQNGINNYKGDFIEDFVHKSNDVKSIKNIGRKSENEFDFIISQLRETIDNLEQHKLTDEETFWIEKSFVYGSLIDDYCHDYYKSNGRLPMFHILANCISSLLKNRYIKVLDAVVSLLSDEGGKKMECVAHELNLTRERIRQICVKTVRYLSEMHNPDDSNIPLYHKLLCQESDWAYVSNKLSEKKLWGIDELSEILLHEECSINKELVLVVLSVLFSDKYVIIGKVPLSVSTRSNGWSNTYIIEKSIADSFNFDVMIDIVKDYESSNTESTTLTIQELLMDTFFSAWKHYDFSVVEDLEYVVGQILVGELGIIPDLDFKYTLEGKKEENTAEILYNLLKESGNPLTIDELYCQLNLVLPDKYRSANSLPPVIHKDSRLCFLGVNRMVALSEWDHIQTGSIRELIVSYLAKFDTPQHIKDIVAFIQEHRDTSERSISSTMGSGDQFVKFDGGYYGLADRKYSEMFNLSKAKKNSMDHIADFEKFIVKNQRYPFCHSNNKDEENLYHWWTRIKRNTGISDMLKQEINRIESLYSDLAKNKYEHQWLSLCHRYGDFVIANGRQPSVRNSAEAELAQWFSKAFDSVADRKLSTLCEKEFVKLCKIL